MEYPRRRKEYVIVPLVMILYFGSSETKTKVSLNLETRENIIFIAESENSLVIRVKNLQRGDGDRFIKDYIKPICNGDCVDYYHLCKNLFFKLIVTTDVNT